MRREAESIRPEASEFARHYSFPEIASMWRLSQNTVRRLFQGEPGVLWISSSRTGRGKRSGYKTGRVPEPVLLRVHRRISGSAA
jgi:hypothetical protein